jgi:hypothetical protein
MTTKLDKPLKREVMVHGDPYVVTITPDGLSIVPKGKRKGYELSWEAFVSGDAALATALNASLLADVSRRSAHARASPARRSARR